MAQGQEPETARTTVSVSGDTWDKLNRLKRRGDSFDDVINRVLDEAGFRDE